ncbi:MAG TPA: Uma2 family endonuclease [Bryobacteraceae bacterium]|nr:Uma2 family endonuclease [Bryobacteraceae bacterium]
MATTALVTSEQYLALPDEFDQNGNRIKDELIGGEIVKMPPAFQLHHLVKMNILEALMKYLAAHPRLELRALSEMPFVVTEKDTLVPDASVITLRRLAPRKDRYIHGSPELAIEVVSPSEKATHLKAKIDAYLANGSQSVWVVYPDARSVMVHASGSVRELKASQTIEDPLLPGFSVPVSAFFELT